jgi:hypothetical protein
MAGRHGFVSAAAADDLRRVQAALTAAPAELRGLLADTASSQLSAAWGQELDRVSPFSAAQEKFVKAGAEARPFGSGLTVITGEPRDDLGRKFEFGTNNREAYSTYARRRNGKTESVTRRTRRALPPRALGGYIAYPAARKLGSRVFNMWAELIYKVTAEAAEGGK